MMAVSWEGDIFSVRWAKECSFGHLLLLLSIDLHHLQKRLRLQRNLVDQVALLPRRHEEQTLCQIMA